ncbi:nuclear transport factor 2 family protein [Pseudoalteromonas sp.]|uniref:nuclear transport factor 2 family protein n=1 Tax=Pseudoalteromonas sp. TaxID=53249 RepID=UPI001BCE82FC|nr:nuclear transport factor 2 family protein [Pseudoalteromonas sp.]
MKFLLPFLAFLFSSVALSINATEPRVQANTSAIKHAKDSAVTEQKAAPEQGELSTSELQTPPVKKVTVESSKADDSKVFGSELTKPVEQPKSKINKAQAIAEAEQALTQAKNALTEKQRDKAKQSRESLAVIEQLVNAYNARNIEEFIRLYDEDVEFYIFPNELLFKGKKKLIARYGLMFKKLKCIHSSPIKRIVHGDIVIDHELSETCSTDANVIDKRSELISSYQIKDGKVIRVLFFR